MSKVIKTVFEPVQIFDEDVVFEGREIELVELVYESVFDPTRNRKVYTLVGQNARPAKITEWHPDELGVSVDGTEIWVDIIGMLVPYPKYDIKLV